MKSQLEAFMLAILLNYCMAQMFVGENFDEFDKSKLHFQNFPYQFLHFNKII